MQIGASIKPVPGYPLAARERVFRTSVQASQEAPHASVRKTSKVDAEALLRYRQSPGDWQQAFPDQRCRHAIQAYSALEQIQQRDYLSQVLGIDEYV
ncbi:MAG: hypothetical protein PVG22_17235 [Chromatiales bacterium]